MLERIPKDVHTTQSLSVKKGDNEMKVGYIAIDINIVDPTEKDKSMLEEVGFDLLVDHEDSKTYTTDCVEFYAEDNPDITEFLNEFVKLCKKYT